MMSNTKFVGDLPLLQQQGQVAGCDFEKMWQEAKSRWLRPSEIFDILINHSIFFISREPVNLPPSGTLVLFDRRMLRNFRRDGHPWRKKKDNKTVKEAHEHLKVGSEEKIHVYYAHGDGDSNLQRRVYWLLDKTLEHVVLVHYLEVKEVVRVNTHHLYHSSPLQPIQTEPHNVYPASMEPMLSSDSSAGLSSAQRLEFRSNADDDFDRFYLDDLQSTGETGFGNGPVESQWLNDAPADIVGQQMNIQCVGNPNGSALMMWDTTPHLPGTTPKLASHSHDGNGQPSHGMQSLIPQNNFQDTDSRRASLDFQSHYASQVHAPESSSSLEMSTQTDEMGGVTRERYDMHATERSSMPWLENGDEVLKKLDSLDRWMQRELPVENKASPLAPSTNSCTVLDPSKGGEENLMEDGGQLAWQSPVTNELTPSFVPQLFFEITDYSPTWGLASEDTKVLITGHFNGDAADFSNIHWHCMFGDELVSTEVVQLGVLRCIFPKSGAPGKMAFYISDNSANVCSDIKHFEFIVGETQAADSAMDHDHEDLKLQHRLARLLLCSHSMSHSKERGKTLAMPVAFTQLAVTMEQEWFYLDKLLNEHSGHLSESKELLLQMFFKCAMMDQISKKSISGTKEWISFDDAGQSALHLAAALGYEWVVPILKASGTSVDFRDKKGWTALHWAASFGRERMVAALLAAGAKPGLVSDPTPGNPSGCTAAYIAAQSGYDGLAGYLSEQDLSSHLQVLTLEESDRDKQCAREQGHRVVEYLRRSASLRRSVKTYEDELALEDSLSAIGNATTTSARIHAAFKEYFMRERLQAIEEADEFGFSMEEQLAVCKIQKAYRKHRDQRLKEDAALRIQKHFRVYKTRKNFINLRQSVIKIQAYYRMHKARKEYKKILWSVGVLEKALLRWRQKGKGLRGYHAEVSVYLEAKGADDFLEIGRKQAEDALEKAVLLVQSMVRSRLARQQYRRMKESFEQAKAAEYASQTRIQVRPDEDAGLLTQMFVTL